MGANARYNGKSSFEEWKKDWQIEDRYNFRTVEKKWQRIWKDENAYCADIDSTKKNFSISFESISYSHCSSYFSRIAFDVINRKKLMEGFNVLYPTEFDAFALPKEDSDEAEIIDAYGIDAFRLYEMFIDPVNQTDVWSDENLNGVYRFINKIFSLFCKVSKAALSAKDMQIMHRCILEVSERIDQMKFNTAVSSLMTYTNYLSVLPEIPEEMYVTLLKLIAPFTPHIAEEMWARLGHTTLIIKESWPHGDTEIAKEDIITIAVQINGKTRGTIEVERDSNKEAVISKAISLNNIAKQLTSPEPQKIIVVPNRIVNIVI